MGKPKTGKIKGQKKEVGGGKNEISANGALSDPRFAAALADPRFQRFPKSQRTVDIDERFAGAVFCLSESNTVATEVQG